MPLPTFLESYPTSVLPNEDGLILQVYAAVPEDHILDVGLMATDIPPDVAATRVLQYEDSGPVHAILGNEGAALSVPARSPVKLLRARRPIMSLLSETLREGIQIYTQTGRPKETEQIRIGASHQLMELRVSGHRFYETPMHIAVAGIRVAYAALTVRTDVHAYRIGSGEELRPILGSHLLQ